MKKLLDKLHAFGTKWFAEISISCIIIFTFSMAITVSELGHNAEHWVVDSILLLANLYWLQREIRNLRKWIKLQNDKHYLLGGSDGIVVGLKTAADILKETTKDIEVPVPPKKDLH